MPTFSQKAVERIRRSVRVTEGMPRDITGQRRTGQPGEASFWAMVWGPHVLTTGPTAGDNPFTWIRCRPDGKGGYIRDPAAYGNFAYEVGGRVNIAQGSVVRLFLMGTNEDGEPLYSFIAPPPPPEHVQVPPHDHRNNENGGFCFSVLHPGTSLPQLPWAM